MSSQPTVPPICRICLSNDELQISLYSRYAQRRLLLTKIRVCLPIKITHADTLPVTICGPCIVRLEQFYEYYCKSETSQRILTEGTSNMSVLQRAKPRPNSFPDNRTCVDSGTSYARKRALSGEGEKDPTPAGGEIDPILTQSPKVKDANVSNELQGHDSISPSQTMSFLLHGQRESSRRKRKVPSKYNEFTTF